MRVQEESRDGEEGEQGGKEEGREELGNLPGS